MPKFNYTEILNLQNEQSVVTAINNNFAELQSMLEEQLFSRDGTEPNYMNNNIDMNDYQIYNLPEPFQPTDAVRKQDLEAAIEALRAELGLS